MKINLFWYKVFYIFSKKIIEPDKLYVQEVSTKVANEILSEDLKKSLFMIFLPGNRTFLNKYKKYLSNRIYSFQCPPPPLAKL